MKEPRITERNFDIYVDGFDEDTRLEIDFERNGIEYDTLGSISLNFNQVESIYNYMRKRKGFEK